MFCSLILNKSYSFQWPLFMLRCKTGPLKGIMLVEHLQASSYKPLRCECTAFMKLSFNKSDTQVQPTWDNTYLPSLPPGFFSYWTCTPQPYSFLWVSHDHGGLRWSLGDIAYPWETMCPLCGKVFWLWVLQLKFLAPNPIHAHYEKELIRTRSEERLLDQGEG